MSGIVAHQELTLFILTFLLLDDSHGLVLVSLAIALIAPMLPSILIIQPCGSSLSISVLDGYDFLFSYVILLR
jgi:hypothetical protein